MEEWTTFQSVAAPLLRDLCTNECNFISWEDYSWKRIEQFLEVAYLDFAALEVDNVCSVMLK